MCLAMPSALRVRNWPFYMWPPSETRPEMVESNTTGVSAATCLVMQGLGSTPRGLRGPAEATCLGSFATTVIYLLVSSRADKERRALPRHHNTTNTTGANDGGCVKQQQPT